MTRSKLIGIVICLILIFLPFILMYLCSYGKSGADASGCVVFIIFTPLSIIGIIGLIIIGLKSL